MSANFEYYKVFYFVGKYGSFTQAAKILHNNQPNITRVINSLENELNCKLFVRSKRGVLLTPEGEKLYNHIEIAYQQIMLGESEITSMRSLQSGSVSISITEIALHVMMLPILQAYRAKYPDIHVQLFNHSTPQGIKALEQGIVDLAVVSSPVMANDSMETIASKSFQDIIIGGKAFKPLSRGKRSLKEIAEYPIITLDRNTASYEFMRSLFLTEGISLEPSVEVSTTDQILPLVSHGIGLGFVPEQFARNAISAKEVVRITPSSPIPPREICLMQNKSHPLNMAALELKNVIMNHMT